MPNILDRVQLGRTERLQNRDDVFGHFELAGGVPSGSVHEQCGYCAGRDGSANFIEMLLHGVCIGEGHHQTGADATRGADGSKQIGVLVTLVLWLAGPRSFLRPLVNDAILLTNPGFILPPNFNRGFGRQVAYRCRQCPREVFLKASIVSGFCPGCWGRGET